ncbi:MAG: DNA translocase FtsK 4TM domain-containing protein [Bacteroidales bacterium]|nr:DNA translocase FtsK 4TM domain-containing protein [Bacteroidales bacterium]MBP3254782.1 DNA translocase FtsK 4TM domain-containing protein [Bacteroidales bacterium]
MAAKKQTKNKQSKKKDTLKQEENVLTMVKHGLKSPQLPLVTGVFLFLFAVFCLLSVISFFFTWATDYDTVKNISAHDLLTGEQNIKNWCGNLGAFTAYYITSHTFGIGSLGLIVICVLFALRLLKVKITLFSKWIVSVTVIMLWMSCITGFIVVGFGVEKLEYFAGLIGIGINSGLCSLMGKVGCAIVLLAFTIVIPMLLFGVKYLWVRQAVNNIASRKTPTQESENNNHQDDNRKDNDQNETKQEQPQQEENPFEQQPQQEEDEEDYEQEPQQEQEQEDYTEQEEENTESEDDEINNGSEQDEIPFIINTQNTDQDQSEEDEDSTAQQQEQPQHYSATDPYDPYKELSFYRFPSTDLLIDYDKNNTFISERELIANKHRIEQTLLNYSIKISSIEATVGPTVTLYEIVPAPGIRISKIKALEDDIALSLSALGIRIIAPIPGKGTIGIEVPNSKPQIVSMKSMLESPQFNDNKFELPIVIGRRIDNTPYACDLAKMPHLLMAGATGQGKSVGLNAIISSLLYKKHPCDLKFIFVDPKKVELSLYSKLEKHYLAKVPNGKEAVITDVKDVVYTLRSLCQEMDTRYELLKQAGCKKITEYNKKFIARRLNPESGHKYMPYIVLVIDEFADLIMTAGKEIEKPICRLAQLARAVGIHLIIATQRPSVNIITGTIKANFPARAAFKVSSLTDSRTILDTKGAEQLIGRGDMLVSNGGPLVRLQCALIDTEEIEKVADFIAEQQGFSECFLLPEVKEEADDDNTEKKSFDDDRLDSKFEEAARLVVMTQQGSTSMLQRKLALGYNRAGRVMDQLEHAGIVGPVRGSKARDVLVTTEEELQSILDSVLKKQA